MRLLERSAELAALGALADEAHSGGHAVALVEGPAGVGKSALLTAAARLGPAALAAGVDTGQGGPPAG